MNPATLWLRAVLSVPSVSQGTTVDEGTAIDLVISTGPAETESESQTQSSYTGTIDFSSLGQSYWRIK